MLSPPAFLEQHSDTTQCFGGLDAAEVEDIWQLLYLILVIAMILAFVVLQALSCFRSKRDQPAH